MTIPLFLLQSGQEVKSYVVMSTVTWLDHHISFI